MSEQVLITDVGPRDGLQNQPRILSVEERLRLIGAIAAAGVTSIEVGSFRLPQSRTRHGGHGRCGQSAAAGTGPAHYTALIPEP